MESAAATTATIQHVVAFARIVNSSQSKDLHEWSADSLERAFTWAKLMEQLAKKAKSDGTTASSELEANLARHLHGATLPSLLPATSLITIDTLCNATRVVCDAVLLSPWLNCHPCRAQLTTLAFKMLINSKRINSGDTLASHSDLFMTQLKTRRSLQCMGLIAEAVGRGCKQTRVQVGAATFEIPSLSSYQLESRTLRLQSLATTLQANAIAVQSLSECQTATKEQDVVTYHDFLARVQDQLHRGNKDVVETIVWGVVLDWPCDRIAIRTDIVKIIEQWLLSPPTRHPFVLEPWLAAKLASHAHAFAHQYLQTLVGAGLCQLDPGELRFRIGALALQGAVLQGAVETQVAQLDSITREQLLL